MWRDIEGYEGIYQISNMGKVKSLPRLVYHYPSKGKILSKKVILSPARNPKTGYLHVSLRKEGKSRSFHIHDLVARTFIGPRPDGHEVCHRDGDKLNNRKSNLYWGIRLKNHADKMGHGTNLHGESQNMAKLTVEKAREIRMRKAKGESFSCLSSAFQVAVGTLQKVISYETWDPRKYRLYADELAAQGNTKEARVKRREAKRLDPFGLYQNQKRGPQPWIKQVE